VNNHRPVDAEILKKVYLYCFQYSRDLVGSRKTLEFFNQSYQRIFPYFHVLKIFKIEANGNLKIDRETLTENELVGFAVWIQQFVKELKDYMVGLSKTEIEDLTREIQDQLNEIQFYDYYHEAQELEY